ncbi:hypothetical protein [Burkholderia sp. S-53]|uniref:hypothetical protein n=1 Tax=Burkholderia sp. S-53 TaxID=2906514 RepID=UPI0021D1A8BE|nr:hypothetical protein [Burkholderia sp. S-53]UXU85487.1 hypothetical protein LXM88_03765 [Burkholderia sp. S-53]
MSSTIHSRVTANSTACDAHALIIVIRYRQESIQGLDPFVEKGTLDRSEYRRILAGGPALNRTQADYPMIAAARYSDAT